LTDYVIADDNAEADDAFINISVKMGAGRPAEFKQAFFGALFSKIKAHCDDLFAKRSLALSLYVDEADEAGSYKHSNIHMRFRKDT
jgi:5-carboxymethyl-2-hydroxymuconate isomerase